MSALRSGGREFDSHGRRLGMCRLGAHVSVSPFCVGETLNTITFTFKKTYYLFFLKMIPFPLFSGLVSNILWCDSAVQFEVVLSSLGCSHLCLVYYKGGLNFKGDNMPLQR